MTVASRRRSLVALVLAAAAAATVVLTSGGDGDPADTGLGLPGSTLEATFTDSDGNGVLERGPGEPLRPRTELASPAPRGRELASFAQITDAHVRDEESPARASVLDRLDTRLNSTFRPQEALSPQVLAAAVGSINELGVDATVVTGDLIDNAQRNELEQALALLEGGRVEPGSGDRGYVGPQQASNPDPFFYRPDVDPPQSPGLLERAQRPFDAPGLDGPWYAVAGNHDLLVQGEVPPTPALNELATGGELLRGLRPDYEPPSEVDELTPELVAQVLAGGPPGPTESVPADPARGLLDAGATTDRLRAASAAGGSGERLDYSFDIGGAVRGIALDVVDRAGGSGGTIAGAEQVAWLEQELRRAGDRRVLVFSHQPLESTDGGELLLGALDRDARVVAAISGHTHANSIEPRTSESGGYWLIGTASLTDYPQQTRAFRLRETEGGGVALETWMLNTRTDPLADRARDLAFLDAQGGRPQGAAGTARDRNATLYR